MFRKGRPLTSADAITIPPISEIAPRITELGDARAALGTEASALRAEDFKLAHDDGPENVDATRDARVAEILGRTPPRVNPPRSARRQEIAERLRDIAHAADVLTRERDTERSRATAVVRERLAPEYKKMMRALIDALISAHTAQHAIRGFVSRVEDAGYSTGWMDAHPCRWLDIGPNGNIGRFVDEKRAAGFIDARDIPEELCS